MLVVVEEREPLAEMERDLLVAQEEMVVQGYNLQLLEQQHIMPVEVAGAHTKAVLQVVPVD
jgi:hypothetical protein